MIRLPPSPTLFPYTTLFRSAPRDRGPRPRQRWVRAARGAGAAAAAAPHTAGRHERDRKSTRLNSSHVAISYAVFCLKKKKINKRSLMQLHNLKKAYHRMKND